MQGEAATPRLNYEVSKHLAAFLNLPLDRTYNLTTLIYLVLAPALANQ
jgi:hypothetical protein